MGKCSLADCKNECFKQEDKCILHCNKNENNGWYKFNENDKKIWSTEKVKLFWKQVANETSSITENENSMKVVSLELKQDSNYEIFNYHFTKVIFPESIFDLIDDRSFFGLDKDINIYFVKCIFLGLNDFSLISKAKNVTFQNCQFFEDVEFKHIEFNNIFLFEDCQVNKMIIFQNIIFKGTSSFINSKFHKKLNFIHSRFDDLALFNDIKAEKLLLDNTFFRGEANFLKINANMADRETARIIKNSFEQQNNIIEANRFYTREMEEREKELTFLKNPVEWLIFKFHSVTSNHSQDPISPIIWIFSISFFYLTFTQINLQDYSFGNSLYYHVVNIMAILITLSLYYKKCEISHIGKILYVGALQLSYLKFISNCSYSEIFNTIADKINPFSIMTGKDTITFGLLLFKVIIAYLIYQFIVSVRQNTRRK